MKKKILLGLLACALTFSFAHAQINTGDIVGTVTLAEDGSVLPGVTVTLTGNVTGKMTAVTSSQGNYRFLKLAPGFYDLVYELSGFKTVTNQQIRVNVGVTTTLNVAMEPGALEENITVVGQKTMINLRQTTVAATVTREVMDTLPLGRGYLTVVNMAPGILPEAQGGGITGGSQLFYGPGTTAEKNSWAVDGASTDGRFYPGEIGASISKNQLEETQVSISSHDIMNISGGVQVNFVSKRGGNRVSGDMFIELMDKKFEMNQTLPDAMKARGWVPAGVNRIWDFAASVGGPVWKDHLWYFASGSISDPITRSYTGGTTRPTFTGNYYAKVNAQYKKTTAQFSYNWADGQTYNISSSTYNPSMLSRTISPSSLYTAEIQHVWGNLLLTAKSTIAKTNYSLHDNDEKWLPDAKDYESGRRIRFPGRAWSYNYAYSAPKSALPPISMMLAQDERGDRPYFVAYADYFAEKLLGGSHEFKLGVDFANNKFNREQLLPNGLSLYVNAKDPTFTWPNGYKPGVVKRFYFRDDIVGKRYTKRQSVFFQDTATYKKLTVTLGLRWDRNIWGWEDTYMGRMEPFNPGATNGEWEPWCIDLKVKADTVPVKPTALSPRVSFTYDLLGDGKNVFKASFAQYNGILNNRYNEGMAPGAGRVIYAPYFDYDNDNWPDEGEFYRYSLAKYAKIQAEKTEPGWAYYAYGGQLSPVSAPSATASSNVYDPDWKTPTVTEFVLGYERQLTQDISVGVNGYHKKETNDIQTLRYQGTKENYTVQWPHEVTFTKMGADPVTGNEVYTANPRPPTVGNFFTHDRYNWSYYWGLEFTFHKRLSHRWMFNGSFNYQDYKYHKDERGYNPSQYYYFADGAADPASYRSGLIYYNARWMVKANGLYQLPWGFNISGTLIGNEGNPVYNGRNTMYGITLYPKDEKYGDLRLADIWQVNLALEKQFALADSVNLVLEARCFNVFNNTTIIRVGQQQVPQTMTPDSVIAPGIVQFGVRLNWR